MRRALKHLFQSKLSKMIAKCSILPATVFSKQQIRQITEEFNRFWGLEKKAPCLKKHEQFSTFTLKKPKSLWTYYFSTASQIEELKKIYKPSSFTLQAEDKNHLCGMHFQYIGPTKPFKRYLIVFNGNGELYRIGAQAWLFKLLIKSEDTAFDIIMFDHRECGFSQGKAHAEGLIKDGEAVYNFIKTKYHLSDDEIDLCGFSLGGAIATAVKSKYPHSQGCLISNRSFQSLEEAIKGFFSPSKNPIKRFFSYLAVKIAHTSHWQLDPLTAWKQISSRKMVISHKEDPVIAHSASLEKALDKQNLLQKCHHIKLIQKNPHIRIKNHHVQPLSFYNDQHGHDVENEILSFLLSFSKKHPSKSAAD